MSGSTRVEGGRMCGLRICSSETIRIELSASSRGLTLAWRMFLL